MFEHKGFYAIRELLQEQVTDFDILREMPVVFRVAGKHLVAAPVSFLDHPLFIQDLAVILARNYDMFVQVEFLTKQTVRDQGAMEKAISHVNLFSATVGYKRFMREEVPLFVRRWAKTIKGSGDKARLVPIPRFGWRKLLAPFSAHELLQVFFMLFVFNYDIVKDTTLDFLSRLSAGSGAGQARSTSSASTRKSSAPVRMPSYSEKPFKKSDLSLLEQQSQSARSAN